MYSFVLIYCFFVNHSCKPLVLKMVACFYAIAFFKFHKYVLKIGVLLLFISKHGPSVWVTLGRRLS